jgi:hypothetical protein
MNALGLSQIAARLDSVLLHQVESTVSMLLGADSRSPFITPCSSTLNNDGSPLQLCVSVSSRTSSVRFIADPAYSATTHSQRLERSQGAIARLCSATSAPIAEVSNQILRGILPDTESQSARTSGILWTASSVQRQGAAIYVNARWNSAEDDWERVLSTVSSILPQARDARNLLCELRKCARIASVGIESDTSGEIRIKTYWRFSVPVPFRSSGIALLHHPAFAAFLQSVLSNRETPLSALVCSAGFLLSSGELEDIKIDLCAHCVPFKLQEWLTLADDLTTENSLQPFSLSNVLLRGRAEVAFLGFGITRSEKRRLNLYLKPPHATAN